MKRFLVWVVFIAMAVTTGYITFVYYANFSEGKRAGEIIKISKKGIVFKTHEGQLNTGGFGEGDGDITSSIWHFSVRKNDTQVLKDIDAAIDGGYRVKLYYHEKFATLFFLGDTKYFVYKVERVMED